MAEEKGKPEVAEDFDFIDPKDARAQLPSLARLALDSICSGVPMGGAAYAEARDFDIMRRLTDSGQLCLLHFDKDVMVYANQSARELVGLGDHYQGTPHSDAILSAEQWGEIRRVELVDTAAIMFLRGYYFVGYSIMAPSEKNYSRRKGNLQAFRMAAKAVRRSDLSFREIAAEAVLHEMKFGSHKVNGHDIPFNLYSEETVYVGRRGTRRVDIEGDPAFGAALHNEDGSVVRGLLYGLAECKSHYNTLLERLKPLDEWGAKAILTRHQPAPRKAGQQEAGCSS